MGVLIEPSHDPDFFKSIPDLCPAICKFTEKQGRTLVSKFGNLFVKHNVYKNFGLVVVHRHFDLNSDEILVETMNRDKTLSAALPWNIKDDKATPTDDPLWKSMDLAEKEFVVPQTWSFGGTGDLKVFEYCSASQILENPSKEFVSELFGSLKEYGLENIIGLRRITCDESFWESTAEGARVSISTIGSKPRNVDMDDMIAVGWRFDETGQVPNEGMDFCLICLFCGSCKNGR